MSEERGFVHSQARGELGATKATLNPLRDALRCTTTIACANAEMDLATRLAPKLPRAAEAKKTLANLFAAPGDIRVGRKAITVCLSPAGTRHERKAFDELLDAVNRLTTVSFIAGVIAIPPTTTLALPEFHETDVVFVANLSP